ncbi:Non-specific lipid-transfer protein [Homalodisca vitripennis]|nr:Non-specific lipid-transfer protein [Homalodisca vitripennis]
MWEEYSRNPNSVLDWQLQFRDFMFDLEDTSEWDLRNHTEKFGELWVEYFASEDPSAPGNFIFGVWVWVFVGVNGTLEITREKFGELWVEYFASEDPFAPGNFIFGVTKFE